MRHTRSRSATRFAEVAETGQADRRAGADADRPRHLRRAGLQVQSPGAGHHAAELAALMDQVPAQPAAGGQHDQRERRVDRAVAAAEPHRDLRPPRAAAKRTPPISRATGRRRCASRRRTRTRTRPSARWKPSATRRRKTTEFFETQKRLATEHSVIEDTGKGMGERTATRGERRGQTGGRVHRGAAGRECRGGARSAEAAAAGQARNSSSRRSTN